MNVEKERKIAIGLTFLGIIGLFVVAALFGLSVLISDITVWLGGV